MADLYLTPAERYTAALGGFYYGDLPEPGTVYTQLIKDILDGTTPDKEPKNILARFIYSIYISDLGDPYPRYELAKLLYWKLHDITPTKSGSILTVTIDGKEDYMTINTDLSRLWYKVLFGSKTDVITEFPYIFNTMQNKLSDWALFGNVEVSGAPTPDNPIMPEGAGERTGNLLNVGSWYGDYKQPDGTYQATRAQLYAVKIKPFTSDDIGKTFTFAMDIAPVSGNVRVAANNGGIVTNGNSAARSVVTFTVATVDDTIYFNYGSFSVTITTISNIMLNAGSTALPYEPYGYKIPISSASTTTPVYLGEVQTTRKIKKLVLTGKEYWTLQSINSYEIANLWTRLPAKFRNQGVGLSTHLTLQTTLIADTETEGFYLASSDVLYIRINTTRVSTVTDFKSYLAAQYAAGTPVCVWYVLANEETAVVNEPLMKIGEYADSMSRTQTGIDIPTVIGQNTLDVLTTVKPSSMSIEYTSADETRSRSKRISLLKSPLKKGLIK